jgi:hypothetical protein
MLGICICIYIYIHTHTHLLPCVYMNTFTHTYAYIHTSMPTCLTFYSHTFMQTLGVRLGALMLGSTYILAAIRGTFIMQHAHHLPWQTCLSHAAVTNMPILTYAKLMWGPGTRPQAELRFGFGRVPCSSAQRVRACLQNMRWRHLLTCTWSSYSSSFRPAVRLLFTCVQPQERIIFMTHCKHLVNNEPSQMTFSLAIYMQTYIYIYRHTCCNTYIYI